jgi:hypothetical protein
MGDRQESYAAIKVIGYGLLVCDLLVFFFLPSSYKVGHEYAFLGIIFGLLVVG